MIRLLYHRCRMMSSTGKSSNKPHAFIGETEERFLSLLREGLVPRDACREVGVSYDTYHDWMMKGGDPASRAKARCPDTVQWEPYWTFARRVREARAEGSRHVRPGKPKGRLPSEITPAQQEIIFHGLTNGYSYHEVCRQADITLSTFAAWLRLGGYPRQISLYRPIARQYVAEPYQTFVQRVLAAEDAYLGS